MYLARIFVRILTRTTNDPEFFFQWMYVKTRWLDEQFCI